MGEKATIRGKKKARPSGGKTKGLGVVCLLPASLCVQCRRQGEQGFLGVRGKETAKHREMDLSVREAYLQGKDDHCSRECQPHA